MPSYPSFLTFAQYSSNDPGKPQLVASSFSLNVSLIVKFGRREDAIPSNDVSSRAVVAELEVCKKFLRFKVNIIYYEFIQSLNPSGKNIFNNFSSCIC